MPAFPNPNSIQSAPPSNPNSQVPLRLLQPRHQPSTQNLVNSPPTEKPSNPSNKSKPNPAAPIVSPTTVSPNSDPPWNNIKAPTTSTTSPLGNPSRINWHNVTSSPPKSQTPSSSRARIRNGYRSESMDSHSCSTKFEKW